MDQITDPQTQPFDLPAVIARCQGTARRTWIRIAGIAALLIVTITLIVMVLRLPDQAPPTPWETALYIATVISLLATLFIVPSILFHKPSTRKQLLERTKANAIIQAALPDLPPWESPIPIEDLQQKRTHWKKQVLYVIIMLPLQIGIWLGIKYLWPAVPDVTEEISGFVLAIIFVILFPTSPEDSAQTRLTIEQHMQATKMRLAERGESEQVAQIEEQQKNLARVGSVTGTPPDPSVTRRRTIGLIALVIIAGIACMAAITWFDPHLESALIWMAETVGGPGWMVVIILGGCVLMLAVLELISRRPRARILRANYRGDYEAALYHLDQIKDQQMPYALQLFLRGLTLYAAGRPAQAEQVLRQNLELTRGTNPPRQQSAILTNLGLALLAQQRYAATTRVLQAALTIAPCAAYAYSALAEVYLFQHAQPQLALRLARQGLRARWRRPPHTWLGDWHLLGETWADIAWAHAQLNQPDEAKAALDRALRLAPRRYAAARAGVYYRAARTFEQLDMPTAARENDHLAQQIDPHGYYGQLAAQALR